MEGTTPQPAWRTEHAAAGGMQHLPPDDKKRVTHTPEEVRQLYKGPTTGRNTKLGRKVEKPADPKAGGPSGQRDNGKHNKKHANK